MNVVDVKELIALEYLDFEGKYKNYEEAHNFWEMCYVEKGEIDLCIDGQTQTLSAGDLAFVAPAATHSYKSAKGNENRAFVVCFECNSKAMKLLGDLPVAAGELTDCISKIVAESQNTFRMNEKETLEVIAAPSFGGQQAVLLQLEYLLICLIRRASASKFSEIVFLDDEKFYGDLVQDVMQYFQENVYRKLSLQDLCEKFNYSRSFLCDVFKRETGQSLFACFNRIKVEEAKRLLLETNLSVTEISAKFGFAEPKYFGALFKKETGLAPSQYREKRRKK
jgi:AraC-like DNA-binding protein